MAKLYDSLYARLTANIFHELVEDEQSCWVWKRKRNKKGYPELNIWKFGRAMKHYAHRIMYQLTHGSIPTGWEVDHLCHNPSCINPDHLQAVPKPINAHSRWRGRGA